MLYPMTEGMVHLDWSSLDLRDFPGSGLRMRCFGRAYCCKIFNNRFYIVYSKIFFENSEVFVEGSLSGNHYRSETIALYIQLHPRACTSYQCATPFILGSQFIDWCTASLSRACHPHALCSDGLQLGRPIGRIDHNCGQSTSTRGMSVEET